EGRARGEGPVQSAQRGASSARTESACVGSNTRVVRIELERQHGRARLPALEYWQPARSVRLRRREHRAGQRRRDGRFAARRVDALFRTPLEHLGARVYARRNWGVLPLGRFALDDARLRPSCGGRSAASAERYAAGGSNRASGRGLVTLLGRIAKSEMHFG